MAEPSNEFVSLHMDPDLFRSALHYTGQTTGFRGDLIEKDYFCSLILRLLFNHSTTLVFKGGTCFSKVHAGFYRLSEDLDFLIPVQPGTTRTERRQLIDPLKKKLQEMAKIVAGLDLVEPLTGHNQSTQYLACFQYPSSILEKSGSIKIEIALREPLLLPARHLSAHTLLRDPFSREEAIEPFFVQAIAFEEACAEKTRAALSRREPAIRDFFDLDFAVRNLRLDLFNGNLLQLIKKKLSVSGNEAVDVSLKRKQKLAIQVGTQLGPVLREQDFREFDLERAFDLVRRVAGSLEELPEEKPPSSKKPKRK